MKTLADLSDAGKDELALALILWRDFKSDGRFDVTVIKQMLALGELLEITDNLNAMMPKVPPMRIVPR